MRLLWKCCFFLLFVSCILTSQISNDIPKPIAGEKISTDVIREPRFAQHGGIFGFFQTLISIKNLFGEQYSDTTNALRKVMDLVNDNFSDTARSADNKPIKSSLVTSNATTVAPTNSPAGSESTTTEKYRISRQELGYILGKNYRGLQKLLRIELDDAANQSRQSIREYRREFGNALVPYTIVKTPSTKKTKRRNANKN